MKTKFYLFFTNVKNIIEGEKMLRLVIPEGRLEKRVFRIFNQAGLPIVSGEKRGRSLKIDDNRIEEVFMLESQEIPYYVEEGEFDLGITSYDWIIETDSAIKEIIDLGLTERGWRNIAVVLATDDSNPVNNVDEIEANSRVITRYPRITKKFFEKIGKREIIISKLYGTTIEKVPRLAKYLVDTIETGEILEWNKKKILAVIFKTSIKLITNEEAWSDPQKRQAIEEVASLLKAVSIIKDSVLVTMCVFRAQIGKLLNYLPPAAVTSIYVRGYSSEERWITVGVMINKAMIDEIIPQVKQIGTRVCICG